MEPISGAVPSHSEHSDTRQRLPVLKHSQTLDARDRQQQKMEGVVRLSVQSSNSNSFIRWLFLIILLGLPQPTASCSSHLRKKDTHPWRQCQRQQQLAPNAEEKTYRERGKHTRIFHSHTLPASTNFLKSVKNCLQAPKTSSHLVT